MAIASPELLTLPELFAALLGAGIPLQLPERYEVLETLQYEGRRAEAMIGSTSALHERMTAQGDLAKLATLPEGFFLAGFKEQRRGAYAFLWCQVDALQRVYFRFPTVATPVDGERGRARLLTFLESYEKLLTGGYGPRVTRIEAHESMGDARYEVTLDDGRRCTHKESLISSADLSVLVTCAR